LPKESSKHATSLREQGLLKLQTLGFSALRDYILTYIDVLKGKVHLLSHLESCKLRYSPQKTHCPRTSSRNHLSKEAQPADSGAENNQLDSKENHSRNLDG